MKIIYLIDTLEGYGAEKSLVQIALNLKKVVPVFIHIYKGDKLKGTLEKNGIKVYSLDLEGNKNYKNALDLIFPILEEEQPDILHSTLFRADMLARKIKGKNQDLLLVGSFVSNSYSKQRYRQLSLISKLKLLSTQLRDGLSAGRVDYFICNSEAIKKTNTRSLRISEDVVKVIHRGRDFNSPISCKGKTALLRKELNIKEQKVFLNIGRLTKGKGQLGLLRAFKKLNQKTPETVLLFVGEGPFRAKLQNEKKVLGLGKEVSFLGYREDIPELLEASDFFVFPSYYEGLPGALIEAIMVKTPTIVSDIPENLECFPSDTALAFPVGDINSLHSKMEQALNLKDWEKRTELSYKYACEKFNILRISEAYDSFYYDIIKRKKD